MNRFTFTEEYETVLTDATTSCQQVELLWLVFAKSGWQHGDVSGARGILAKAFGHNAKSEGIWIAAVKLESETTSLNVLPLFLKSSTQRAFVTDLDEECLACVVSG
ncbi:hypothetical protein KIN20_020078 [Parelaphostrongylus tenuis]|uniref:Uncharacterized protein n=1 Tax=Parelaphostrongylus tenuis TaxID=148309 RepID=A0AAD5N634_PARTN|nr:hypothetical protein KIN20_020078 [Parelaphostrongylus tenuis]